MLKKEFMITLAALMITLSFTGCQKNEDANAKNDKEQSVAQAGDEKDKEGKVEENTGEEPQFEVYLGKVKSIVGNEIQLDLAKDEQFEQEAPEPPKEGEEGSIAAVTMTPATSGDKEQENIPGAAKEAKLELEYTGEVKDFVVPAGASINGSFGTGGKVTDIKEGAVIQVIGMVEGDNLMIDNITILE